MEEFDYKGYLSKIGICKGDIVDVASDLLSFMIYCRQKKLKFNPNHFIDILLDLIGEEGTVLIRTFTWAFCRGDTFDILNTPSEVGSLGNIAMKRDDFKRTKHPIYSWSVYGKDQDYLISLNNSDSFGCNTPWEYFCNNNAKLVLLGNTDVLAITVIHHFEQILNVPYRANKIFESEYINELGEHSIRRYSMFVSPLNIKTENFIDKWWSEIVNKYDINKEILFDSFLKGNYFNYKDIEKFATEEINNFYSEHIWMFDGLRGYNNPNLNWNTARYYRI